MSSILGAVGAKATTDPDLRARVEALKQALCPDDPIDEALLHVFSLWEQCNGDPVTDAAFRRAVQRYIELALIDLERARMEQFGRWLREHFEKMRAEDPERWNRVRYGPARAGGCGALRA